MPRPAVLVAGAGLGLSLGLYLAGCQGPDEYFRGLNTGQAGDIGSGTGGNVGPGTGGNVGPGTGGNVGPGAGGSVGPGAGGSATGTAGSSAVGAGGSGNPGTAGTTGAAGSATGGSTGRGGTTGSGGAGGTTGAGGRGGAAGTGAAGTSGAAGRGGAGGGAGRGGTGGAAGSAGTTGRGGRGGGAAGTGGAGGAGMNSCPLGGRLDCTAAGSLDLMPDGQVVDFSAAQWNNTTDKWCNALGLDGGLFSFAGTGSTAMVDVDTTARNLALDLTVSAGQYAGGGVNFDSCVDATGFNAVQFTASIGSGSLNGCTWQIQLQTRDQIPTTDTDPTGGSCAATATCRRHPAATLTAATTTATTFTTRFTAFNNPAGSTTPTASQIVGLQWQVNSGNSGSGTCNVELRIDNARFVTQ